MAAVTAARAAAGVAAVAGGSALALHAYMTAHFGDEALPRMWRAYSVAVPAFLHYKAVQLRHEVLPPRLGWPVDAAAVDAEYERLHDTWAPRMLDMVLDLRGFNLKTGQMIASDFGGVAPPKWQRAFEPLLDRVPHKPFAEVRAIVEGELGRPLGDVYATFDEQPLASASIGQVHRATLAATGERVVVKVQHPEAERLFRGDVHTARTFAAVAVPEHVPALAEVERQFASEFAFHVEADNLALVRGNLARAPRYRDIAVPAPLPSLCTKRVLTMEEIPHAIKLTDALREDMAAHAASRGVSLAVLLAEERAANERALAAGVLRCGPDAATMARYIAALRWRNWLGSWVGARPVHVPRNHAALVDTLLEVHGHMALVDGAINGDPHPGNILLSRRAPRGPPAGGGGRNGGGGGSSPGDALVTPNLGDETLALVDFGQVKRLSPQQRLQLARLIVALARCEPSNPAHRAAVAARLREMGMVTERNDPDVLFKYAQLFFDADDKLVTGGQNVQVCASSRGWLRTHTQPLLNATPAPCRPPRPLAPDALPRARCAHQPPSAPPRPLPLPIHAPLPTHPDPRGAGVRRGAQRGGPHRHRGRRLCARVARVAHAARAGPLAQPAPQRRGGVGAHRGARAARRGRGPAGGAAVRSASAAGGAPSLRGCARLARRLPAPELERCSRWCIDWCTVGLARVRLCVSTGPGDYSYACSPTINARGGVSPGDTSSRPEAYKKAQA